MPLTRDSRQREKHCPTNHSSRPVVFAVEVRLGFPHMYFPVKGDVVKAPAETGME
jgi:hypothetical protein